MFDRIRVPVLAAGLMALAVVTAVHAEDEPAPQAIDAVLSPGPLPVEAKQVGDSAKADEIARAVVTRLADGAPPAAGRSFTAFSRELEWQWRSPADAEDGKALHVWAIHLDTERFVRGRLQLTGLRSARLWHDARRIENGGEGHELELRNGSHTLWLIHHGADGETEPGIQWQGRADHDRVTLREAPLRRVSPERLTNAETVTDMTLSPDGRRLALAYSGRDDSADIEIGRLEIRATGSGEIQRQWTDRHPDTLAWSPDGRYLAVAASDNLWLHPVDNGRARLLLANHEDIGEWRWHPDSGSIVFSWTDKAEDNDQRRRVRSLEDRWAGFRDNSQLYQVDVPGGLIRPLTASERSVSLHDIAPDGDRLLASERLIDYAEPPHGLFRLFEIDLDSLEQREIIRLRQFSDIRFADDGYWLLAGPGLPVGDGATTGEEVEPNEYDTQLYLLAENGESARSMSRDFDPSIGEIERLPGGDLLLSAVAGERVELARFDAGQREFAPIETGVAVMESFAASSQQSPVIAVRGSDADRPQRVHLIDAEDNDNRLLLDTATGEYADVVFGEVRPWSFTNADGVEIEGRYYLPPDFDGESDYPLIVYYYGGTSPVNRQFTGRYPFNLWAAQGYVIYVLQPRGTVGYGQEFSAKHVNAWGEYAADDIIEGTEKFVAEHDFVDAERIGNIGASYGGFMTMNLATKTDRFAASISHAGISTLTSYWGEGWWGYGYSGVASKGSFPWNNRELYVEHSPIYNADDITTPLLLLHGDSDTNVPPGESRTMYTALRLLDREVAMVEFPGQDHWILDREQRYVWWDTILAWFDRYLKDQPEWWQHLYPEAEDD